VQNPGRSGRAAGKGNIEARRDIFGVKIEIFAFGVEVD